MQKPYLQLFHKAATTQTRCLQSRYNLTQSIVAVGGFFSTNLVPTKLPTQLPTVVVIVTYFYRFVYVNKTNVLFINN